MFDQSTLAQVDDKAKQYMNNPEALQKMYQQKQQLIDLLALQKIKSEKEAAARDIQLKMAQQSGQPQTIAQQREQQVLDLTKQEMLGQQAGNIQQKQQEQQQNLQSVLKGMAQGAQLPQQSQPGMAPPQAPGQPGAAPGVAALRAPGLMPPKAMASGGIVAFSGEDESYVDFEEEWKRRQEELAARGTGAEKPRSWFQRNIYDTDERDYKRARDRAADIMQHTEGTLEGGSRYDVTRGGPFTAETNAQIKARQAKNALLENLRAGKYDPTGKPLVPMVGKETQEAAYARIDNANKNVPAKDVPVKDVPPKLDLTGANKNKNKDKDKDKDKGGLPDLNTPTPAKPASATGLESIINQAVTKQVQRDPEAEAKAKREAMNKEIGYNQEERAAFEKNRAAMEAFDKAQFDPEVKRQQQLEDFLLGAAGHSTAGMTLGSAGKAAVSRQRMQTAAERGAMGERQKKLEDFLESGRKSREESAKIGEKTAEVAEMGTRQGIASGASMVDMDKQMISAGLDRQSREKIALIQAQVQREVNAATKEGTLELRRATLLESINKGEESAVATARKSSPEYATLKNLAGFEAMGKLDKNQMAQKQAAEAKLDALEVSIRNKFQETRDIVMSGSGSGIAGLNKKGWGAVEEVKPAKK